MTRVGLTGCMIVRDERANLEALLPTLRGSVDALVIVDTGSADGSREVARAAGALVVERPWDDDFSAARNAGLERVTTSHAIWVDADDRIDPADLAKVRAAVRRRPEAAWMTLLVNEASDPSAVTSCWQLRVFPARVEHRFEGRIHEQLLVALRTTGTPIDRVDATIHHLGYVDPDEVLRKSRRNFALLQRELAAGGEDVTTLYHLMRAASMCGEPEAALSAADRLVATAAPGTPRDVIQAAEIIRSRLLFQRGRTDEALAELRRAVDRVPDDATARFFLAELLRRTGDLHSASRELAAARACPIRLETIPVPVAGLRRAIRNTHGEILEQLATPAEAMVAYREALDEAPGDEGLLRALARAGIAAGALDAAETALDALPDDAADLPDCLRLRAALAFSRGRDAEAEALFARVEARLPRDPSAALHRGHLALRAGALDAAAAHYERSLARQSTPEAHVGLAATHLEQRRVAEALDHLVLAVEACPGRPLPPGTEALSGEALLLSGRPEEARDAFERHLRRHGPDARILARLADCYRALGAPQAAQRGYQAALDLSPGLAEAARGLAALAGTGAA